MITAIEDLIGPQYLPLSRETGEAHANREDESIVLLHEFLVAKGVEHFRNEARELFAEHGRRRDLSLNGSERHFISVNGASVQRGTLIPGLLLDDRLKEFVEGVAGMKLDVYGDANEACVLIALRGGGDEHGEHTDDFQAVFNLALASPNKTDDGGVLTFAENGQARAVRLKPGDAYVMRNVDRISHKVTPLKENDSERIIASIAYATRGNANVPSRSSKRLFQS